MFVQDIRFGLRTALKNKGVTGLAVVCLAIGIGLNTMMFSVTDGVLIQPLQDSGRLLALYGTNQPQGIRRSNLPCSKYRTGASAPSRSTPSPRCNIATSR